MLLRQRRIKPYHLRGALLLSAVRRYPTHEPISDSDTSCIITVTLLGRWCWRLVLRFTHYRWLLLSQLPSDKIGAVWGNRTPSFWLEVRCATINIYTAFEICGKYLYTYPCTCQFKFLEPVVEQASQCFWDFHPHLNLRDDREVLSETPHHQSFGHTLAFLLRKIGRPCRTCTCEYLFPKQVR